MGQYYGIYNLNKKEYMNPHKFDDGAKLLEFACSQDGILTPLTILLAHGNGRGGGDLNIVSHRSKLRKSEIDTNFFRFESEWENSGEVHWITVPKIVGSWSGDRIVISGDYDDRGVFIEDGRKLTHNELKQLENHYTDISHFKSTKGLCLMAYAEYLGFYKDVSEDILKAMMVDSYLRHSIKESGISLRPDTILYCDKFRG